MSSFYQHHGYHQHPTPAAAAVSHSHHGGRNRRAARVSISQNSQKQFRQLRMKDIADNKMYDDFRTKFEASRSFDLEDDWEFCPNLLTESDMVSIHSASSERSSLASNSPGHSPSQPAQVPAPFSLDSSAAAFAPAFQSQQATLKLHQPAATRTRNAIPIINPATGISMPSPSPSVSPNSRMQQSFVRRYQVA